MKLSVVIFEESCEQFLSGIISMLEQGDFEDLGRVGLCWFNPGRVGLVEWRIIAREPGYALV